MIPLFNKESAPLRASRRVLEKLETSIDREYSDTVKILQGSMRDPIQVEEMNSILQKLALLGKEIRECSDGLDQGSNMKVCKCLEDWNSQIFDCLLAEPDIHINARRCLTKVLQSLFESQGSLKKYVLDASQLAGTYSPKTVRVSTDLLYQCFQTLFPAERMLAIAGRTKGDRVELGAVFDVTGVASAGHVRADPKKLGQALIAMSATDTHLAAWFHSHPGSGLMNTCPSGTDLRQHKDWLQDYSERLLSGIFVHDNYLRFWGSGLEEGQISISLEGTGIVPVKGEKHVYKIVPN